MPALASPHLHPDAGTTPWDQDRRPPSATVRCRNPLRNAASASSKLLALEHGFWEAAGDGDFYRRHMAEDGLLLIPFGILGKEATIAAVEDAEPWSSHEMEDLVVLEHGGTAATLCYRAEAERDGAAFRAAVSSTYRRRGEHWLLVIHQQTPLQ